MTSVLLQAHSGETHLSSTLYHLEELSQQKKPLLSIHHQGTDGPDFGMKSDRTSNQDQLRRYSLELLQH